MPNQRFQTSSRSSTPPPDNPVLVEVHRGTQVESQHRGCAVAMDGAGRVLFSAGRVSRPVYPRSALKIFQAIPLVADGAADHFALTPAEIALACASHNGEEAHTRAVTRWLARLGCDGDDLECGATPPLLADAARQLAGGGEPPSRVHHNCSGKHAGMLTVAKFMGAGIRGYHDYHHPSQRAWMQALSELAGLDVFSLPWAPDGCGLPAVCMPLEQLARAFARCADPRTVGGKHGAALVRIADAIRAHPHMLAGTGRCCTAVIRAGNGRVLVKTGAEGVYGGAIPHLGIGFALKIEDGATRAAEVALGALLKKLNALEPAGEARLQPHFRPAIRNSLGRVTGRILPSAEWEV